MTNKQLTQILKAIMVTAYLNPNYEDDVFKSASGSSYCNFISGIEDYFSVSKWRYLIATHSLDKMDTPSETIAFFITHKEHLLENFEG